MGVYLGLKMNTVSSFSNKSFAFSQFWTLRWFHLELANARPAVLCQLIIVVSPAYRKTVKSLTIIINNKGPSNCKIRWFIKQANRLMKHIMVFLIREFDRTKWSLILLDASWRATFKTHVSLTIYNIRLKIIRSVISCFKSVNYMYITIYRIISFHSIGNSYKILIELISWVMMSLLSIAPWTCYCCY